MKKSTVALAVLLSSVFIASGCKSNQPSTAPAPAQNAAQPNGGTVNSDGTTTPPGQQTPQQQGPQTQPGTQPPATQQSSRAPESQQRRETPQVAVRREPPPAAPLALTAPIGTTVQVRTTETLSASHNEVGDGFTGVIESPVVADGRTVFAAGTRVTGTVVAAKGRGRFKGAGALGIELSTIAGVRVQTNEYEREAKGKGKRTGALIGGGAGLGALIGGIAGGGKGALIGGLAGAGAGTAGAVYTGNKDVVIPSESLVTFHLAAPFTLRR